MSYNSVFCESLSPSLAVGKVGLLTNMMPHAGPSKLPELGKVLGQTVKSFQGAAKVLVMHPSLVRS